MAPSSLLSQLTTLTSLSSTATVWLVLFANRSIFYSLFHPSRHPLRFLALLLSLILNVKSLPFVWHLRLLKHTYYHLYQRHKVADVPAWKGGVFQSTVVKGLHSPLYECDYNLHKSNSTYFSDADQARTTLMTTLVRQGLQHSSSTSPTTKPTLISPANPALSDPSVARGRYSVSLGAVSCHFKREIAPYQRYDMWTSVLAWDRKWIYLLTHFVREGAGGVEGWLLQPERTSGAKRKGKGDTAKGGKREEEWTKQVFAVSLAKYVVKKGRLTIAPAEWLEQAGVLPRAESMTNGANGENGNGQAGTGRRWTVEDIEARRVKGMEYAEKFAALDGLQEQWPVLKDGHAEGVQELTVLDKEMDMLF